MILQTSEILNIEQKAAMAAVTGRVIIKDSDILGGERRNHSHRQLLTPEKKGNLAPHIIPIT